MTIVQTTTDRFIIDGWYRSSRVGLLIGIGSALMDMMTIMLISVLTGDGYHLVAYQSLGLLSQQMTLGLLTGSVFVGLSAWRRHYHWIGQRGFWQDTRRQFGLWAGTLFVVFFIAFLSKSTAVFSRGWIILFFTAGFVGVMVGRLVIGKLVQRAILAGVVAPPTAILVGNGDELNGFLAMNDEQDLPIEFVNVFYLPENSAHLGECLDRVVESARRLTPDSIMLTVPLDEVDRVSTCLDKLAELPSSVSLVNDGVLSWFEHVEISRAGKYISLDVVRPPMSMASLITKRVVDIFGSLILLVLLSPAFLITAILIKLGSPGPIFFCQRRYGFTQKSFKILKFRSMSASEDGRDVRQAQQNDARITRIGAFIRRTNIDELPQLINVLIGQMSLVGPRPHAMIHDHQFNRKIAYYAQRQKVKPGITGWAQVNGWRGVTDTEEKIKARVEHDLYYIANWSFAFDIKILFLTLFTRKAFRNAG